MTTSTLPTATELDRLCVDTIRMLSIDAVQQANSGHPGTPMALAPIGYLLFTRVMRHSPGHPDWPDRDRFVLSAGHASMLLYSLLYLTGYGLTLEDLRSFRQLGSRTPGHPERGLAPGVETTTGPLGQGIATCVGLALGERMLNARFGDELIDHYTFCIASDGDMQEGISSEASSLAGHLALGRLIVFYDDNHISIEGPTSLAFSEDVGARYEAYGWQVQHLSDGSTLDQVERAAHTAMQVEDRPSLIICRTHIAPGAPHKQDTAEAHGAPLGAEEVRLTKRVYGWPEDEPFYVPAEALEHFRSCVERGSELHGEWAERFDAYRRGHPDRAGEFDRLVERELPAGWDAGLPRFQASEGMTATRKSSHTVLQWVAARVPELVGGSADLAPSTLTRIDDADDVAAGAYRGRNLHFGVREHAMGAIVNGLALHNLRAYGSTFLVFSDYMRASMRLAALMGLPSIFVFTHDSIGLGEDGPTHQPIEQLAGLRAMPGLAVIRPAGANEVALAWRYAIASTEHPSALILSRQGVPTWNPAAVPSDAIERGAYVLRDSYREPHPPELILIATGSEVHVCVGAAELLEADGIATRVVSMPCMANFAAQGGSYRDRVLPPGVKARVSLEAASTGDWHRWVGDLGKAIGMRSYGASAPAGALYRHFGLTPERVAEAGRQTVRRARSEKGVR
ncbi:MAG TPA: transketolase [Solirubrobacteraceae bacterium]|nr:transketolase [Solirubrobacteraceae bacterium]